MPCTVRPMDLGDLQRSIERTFGARDRQRGLPATVAWLAEEVGELARAVRKGSREEQEHELADVLAWLLTLANQVGIDLATVAARYSSGCPTCSSSPCQCESDHWRSTELSA